MKQIWERLAARIDTRSIRERGLLFAVLVVIVVALTNSIAFGPTVAEEARFEKQMQADRNATQKIQFEIQKMATTAQFDPDAENRAKLEKLKADADVAENAVRNLQKGLVSPDQIGGVLESVLNRQGRLRLISLKKLPLESLAVSKPSTETSKDGNPAVAATTASASSAQAQAASGPTESIYKHGVQIVVEGQYFDMLDYLASLEKLPYQIFWGKARLQVSEYPRATLTLDVFTLSLEKKWLSI